ncbi:MAG: hypothetical protein ACOYJB_07470 [Christensenellaceae bacterium]|jgi:hypothetical protein
MRKLIVFVLAAALLLGGCSTGQNTAGGDGLSDRLAGLEHAEFEQPEPSMEAAAEPTVEPTPEPESIPDPFSKEMIDPYNIRTFWDSSKNIDTYCEVMGLHYNSSETDRLLKQAEFMFEIYNGPFEYPLPGIEQAECYAWASPTTGNVFRFDYKHYIDDSMTPEETADLYFNVVEAFGGMTNKSLDIQNYFVDDVKQEGFDWYTVVEQVAAGGEVYSFRSLYGATVNDLDCQEVMLLKRDGVLSLFVRFYLPLENQESLQAQQATKPSTGSSGSSGSNNASTTGKVVFSGLTTYDELPPGEGILEVAGFDASPNSSGGYDCSITIANVSYAMESSIYCMLYALGSDDAMDITLAEYDWFDKGAANTYHFTVPADMVASGDCEVMVEYTFW